MKNENNNNKHELFDFDWWAVQVDYISAIKKRKKKKWCRGKYRKKIKCLDFWCNTVNRGFIDFSKLRPFVKDFFFFFGFSRSGGHKR